jgi:hypothetical protein
VLALAGTLIAPAVPAQTCNPSIRHSAPDSRYVVSAVKGTVLDKQTGLTWKRCVEGRSGTDCGVGAETYLYWVSALNRAAASDFAGYQDWRLPNRKELESLVEVACYGPALNANVFPNDPSSWVWSSSPYANNAGSAGVVYFVNGYASGFSNRYGYYAVRLVRGGQ